MYHLRLLGSLSLEDPSGTNSANLVRQRPLAVLALLAVARDKGCSRDKLIGYLWSEIEQGRARHRLTDTVYLLRRSLGDDAVLSAGDTLRLNPEVVEVDVSCFLDRLDWNDLEAAVDLYRGPFLDGFYVNGVPEFERWVESERQRLADAYSDALEELAERSEQAEDHRRAVNWWKRLAAHDPYNSRYALRLMLALAAAGDRGNALQFAQEHERRLSEELGMEADAELLALAERLRGDADQNGEPRRQPLGLSPETQVPIVSKEGREVAVGDIPEQGVESAAGKPRTVSREHVPVDQRGRHTEARPVSLLRVLATYALVSLAVLAVAHIFTLQFGLPKWFFPGAVVVLLVCLPIILATALVQASTIAARRADSTSEWPSAEARRWLTWRKAIGVTVVAFAVLGLAVAGHMAMRVTGIGPLGTLIGKGVLEEQDRIVLARFENLTPDSTLGLVVTELLRTDLQQSPLVSVAGRDFVAAVVRRMEKDPDQSLDYQTAREVAIREGLKGVVAGQVGSLGSGFVISARLVVAESGEVVFAHRETAEDGDALIPASERLSRRMRERIGESLKSIRSTPRLWRMQTASLEALRLAREADEEIRRGRPSRSVELASRAIELDSLFVGAYMARAMAGGGSGQRMADLKKAYALRDRASLAGRYFIEALYHGAVTGDEDRQLEAMRMCLEVNPRLEGALQLLGLFYFRRARDYTRAEEYFRRRLEQNRYGGTSWHMLFEALAAQGKWEEAEEALRRWQENIPEHPDIPVVRRHLAASRGDYRGAEARTLALGEQHRGDVGWRAWTSYWLAVLARLQGRLAEAERHLDDAVDARESQGRTEKTIYLESVKGDMDRWFKGDTAAALRRMEAALDRWPLDSIAFTDRVYEPYTWIVDFYAQAGRIDEARAYLAQYEAQTEYKNNRRFRMWRHYFRGAIALAEGRPRDAIEEYRQADRLAQCHVCVVPRLAFAYDQAGEPDSALVVYERYVTMPWPYRVERADSWWLAFAYERLGNLYEQRSDTAKAIYYYGKLVDLWKDADPELRPRVEAARRAIAALSPDT